MSRRHDREMPREEMHIFANALRDCLGLGPLYGTEHEAATYYGHKRKQATAATEALLPEAAE